MKLWALVEGYLEGRVSDIRVCRWLFSGVLGGGSSQRDEPGILACDSYRMEFCVLDRSFYFFRSVLLSLMIR